VLKNQFLLKMMSFILLIKVIILTVLFDSFSFQFKFLLLSVPVSSFRALYTDFRVQDFINSLDKLDSSLVYHFTYLYMYFACLSVGKVYGCSKLQTFVSKSFQIFVKFKKCTNKYFKSVNFFLKNVLFLFYKE